MRFNWREQRLAPGAPETPVECRARFERLERKDVGDSA